MGFIFYFVDDYGLSILSSIFTKGSKRLSIGIMFLSIFFRRSFFRFLVWCLFLSLMTYWGLALQLNHLMDFVNPKTPVSILLLDF